MADLSLITTQEMIQELAKRHDFLFVAGCKVTSEDKKPGNKFKDHSIFINIHPHNFASLGFFHLVRKQVEEYFAQELLKTSKLNPGFDQDKL